MKLSDSFEKPNPGFELTATMFNINHGHNKQLMENCKCLQDYALYVKMVKDYLNKGFSPEEAADKAVDDAIGLKLLNGFFARHKAEVMNDFLTDFDKDLYEKTMREEGFEAGREEGREEGCEEGFKVGREETKLLMVKNMLKINFPESDILKLDGVTEELLETAKTQLK